MRGSSSERASRSALGLASCVGGHERPRARARLDDAVDLEGGDRLAHRGTPDLQPLGQVALGRQALAGLQQPHTDLAGDPIGDPLVQLTGLEGAKIGLFYELDHEELVCCVVLVP